MQEQRITLAIFSETSVSRTNWFHGGSVSVTYLWKKLKSISAMPEIITKASNSSFTPEDKQTILEATQWLKDWLQKRGEQKDTEGHYFMPFNEHYEKLFQENFCSFLPPLNF